MHHADPPVGTLHVHCDKCADEATVEQLFQNTFNCARGVAAQAIGRLLWEHDDLSSSFYSSISSLVLDPHASVRMASIQCLLPLLRAEADLATKLFCKACEADPRVACSPYAVEFLNRAIRNHSEPLVDVIRAMVDSGRADVAEMGAQAATAYWLGYGILEQEANLCKHGSAAQRKGVAHIVANNACKSDYASRCRELLTEFFNDPNAEVRGTAATVFDRQLYRVPEGVEIARKYVRSRQFADDPGPVLRSLEWHKGSLLPLSETIVDVCRTASITFPKETRDISTHQFEVGLNLPSLLLRLYEQAEARDPSIASQCLDMWDLLLERRVGTAQRLTSAMEV